MASAREDGHGTLKRTTVAGAAYEELRRRIHTGEIPAGTQLRQDALAQEFGISRIPLREAFLQLEADGLLRINAHKGATVVGLSGPEIDELFELRAMLEPMLLRMSTPRLSAADYAEIEALLDEYSDEMRTQNVLRWGELNTTFHRLLYRRAERPRTLALVLNLLEECERHTRVQLSLAGALPRAEEEHRQILDLCRRGDIDAAARLLEAHVENVAASLRDFGSKSG